MIFIFLAIMVVYMIPGLYIARGLYSEQVRAIRSAPSLPKVIVPPKPARPVIDLNQQLHTAKPEYMRCSLLKKDVRAAACDCQHRDEWIALRNAWIDYDEWQEQYGHLSPERIAQKREREQQPSVGKALAVVPVWPAALAVRFVTAGAKSIPDYREIERLERQELL